MFLGFHFYFYTYKLVNLIRFCKSVQFCKVIYNDNTLNATCVNPEEKTVYENVSGKRIVLSKANTSIKNFKSKTEFTVIIFRNSV